MAIPGQGAAARYWYSDAAPRDPSVAVLEAMRTYRAAETAMRRRTQLSMGMGENDLRALRYVIVAQQDGRSIGPKQLTDHLGISSASTTVLLDRLERAGRLRRDHSPLDRRALVLVPTATTDEEVRAVLGDVPERMVVVASALDEDQATVVVEFLRRMREAVDEIDAGAPHAASAARARAVSAEPGNTRVSEPVAALLQYRSAEEAMRGRTGGTMRMGANDLKALRFLLRAQGAGRTVSGRELGDHLGMTSASVTALLDRLTGSGHVHRTPHPTDRRSNMITATVGSDDEVRQTLGSMHRRMLDASRSLDGAGAATVVSFLAAMTAALDGVAPSTVA